MHAWNVFKVLKNFIRTHRNGTNHSIERLKAEREIKWKTNLLRFMAQNHNQRNPQGQGFRVKHTCTRTTTEYLHRLPDKHYYSVELEWFLRYGEIPSVCVCVRVFSHLHHFDGFWQPFSAFHFTFVSRFALNVSFFFLYLFFSSLRSNRLFNLISDACQHEQLKLSDVSLLVHISAFCSFRSFLTTCGNVLQLCFWQTSNRLSKNSWKCFVKWWK